MRQQVFSYTNSQISNIVRHISQERFRPYLQRANNNILNALRLYEHNIQLSEALYGPLQGLEVTLRNAFHNILSHKYGPTWYDHSVIGHPQTNDVLKAKESLTRQKKALESGRIIAELSFGFWVGLTGSKYDNLLWIPMLHKAFPNKRLGRKECHKSLDQIRKLRNRIAHHEPILDRDLLKDHDLIIGITRWIDIDTSEWLSHISSFAKVNPPQF